MVLSRNETLECSYHFLVWVELGRTAKNSKKGKRVIRWRLDRFGDDEVNLRYQNGLGLKCMESQRALKESRGRHEGT